MAPKRCIVESIQPRTHHCLHSVPGLSNGSDIRERLGINLGRIVVSPQPQYFTPALLRIEGVDECVTEACRGGGAMNSSIPSWLAASSIGAATEYDTNFG